MRSWVHLQIVDAFVELGVSTADTYSCLSNKRYAVISVTPDKFSKINKRYAVKYSLISVTENIF